jgi:cytochrome c
MEFEIMRKIGLALLIVPFIGMVPPAVAQVAGDPVAGQKAFGACAVCHTVKPGASSVGPNLLGVAGKKAGTNDPKFKYTAAMKAAPVWTDAQLDTFISNPKGTVPGTAMAMAPTKDAQKRADIIAYLKSLGGN